MSAERLTPVGPLALACLLWGCAATSTTAADDPGRDPRDATPAHGDAGAGPGATMGDAGNTWSLSDAGGADGATGDDAALDDAGLDDADLSVADLDVSEPPDAIIPDAEPPELPPIPERRVGIFYLVWHAYAADAMAQIPEGERVTLEAAIADPDRSQAEQLSERGLMQQAASFHYHVEPEQGFYCMYRPRPGEAPYPEPDAIADCGDISAVAEAHARQLWAAGVDFVFVDVTNLPFQSRFTDVLGVRPLEVLFEEWQALRDRGVMTPQIGAWVPMPPRPADAGPHTVDALLDGVYADPRYDDLVLRDDAGRKVIFAVENGGFPIDPAVRARAEDHGGRQDVVVAPMWGNLSEAELSGGRLSWMQPCRAPAPPNGDLQFTTLPHPEDPCLQGHTPGSPIGSAVSVSGSYQIGYASLPFQASGHNEGLTLKRQFATAFELSPDWLMINSWNELIAQPQRNPDVARHGALGRSMGITAPPEGDPSGDWLWVDMYGAEFSRELEPTVEYGDERYRLLRSCLRAYRAGGCGRWEAVCNPFYGPPSLCGEGAAPTGDGPFQVLAQPGQGRLGLYRCYTGQGHFLSLDPGCEGQRVEGQLGYVADARSSHAPRPLSRCYNTEARVHFHWLAERCPERPGVRHESVLGHVR